MAKKKKKKLSKKQRNKRIAIGAGATVTVGILGFLGYKYYSNIKNYFKGLNANGEKLSSVKEFAELGLSDREEKEVIQNARIAVQSLENAKAAGNTKQAEKIQQDIQNMADRTYAGQRAETACFEDKYKDFYVCKYNLSFLEKAKTGVYTADEEQPLLIWKNGDIAKKWKQEGRW
ncbi:hypothetical protein V9L05_08710 [Bernardetia sp. Wsw4-3y2]|uniref:hypothetical protein n=1 Tax=Bernardetia sp. Wsw4-3y2 TaxID=3127471 RepID=UPI0030CCE866